MQAATLQPDRHHDCLAKLNRALDLAMKTAEAASAENNHKVVIQAVREVTRIVTLINKMAHTSDPKPKPKPKSTPISLLGSVRSENAAPPAFPLSCRDKQAGSDLQAGKQQRKTCHQLPAMPVPDLETLFPPQEVATWDGLSQNLFKNISRNFAELQALATESACSLQEPDQGNGTSSVSSSGQPS